MSQKNIFSALKEAAAAYRLRRKVKHQTLNFYIMSDCPQPDLDGLEFIHIPAGDTDAYRAHCGRFGLEVPEKHLQRIMEGSSYWCLAAEGEVLTGGWVAFRQHFYIRETDFAFDMANSDVGILYNFVTAPAHRGKGLLGKLLSAIVCSDQSPDRFFHYVRPENTSSCKGVLKTSSRLDGVFPASDPEKTVAYLTQLGFTNITRKY